MLLKIENQGEIWIDKYFDWKWLEKNLVSLQNLINLMKVDQFHSFSI